jgi:hypothetical protein
MQNAERCLRRDARQFVQGNRSEGVSLSLRRTGRSDALPRRWQFRNPYYDSSFVTNIAGPVSDSNTPRHSAHGSGGQPPFCPHPTHRYECF